MLSDALYSEAVAAVRFLVSLDKRFAAAVERNPRAVRSIFSRVGTAGDGAEPHTGRWLSAREASTLARVSNTSVAARAFQEMWNLTVSPVSEPPSALVVLSPPFSTQGDRVCAIMDEFRAGVVARGWQNEYYFVGAVMEICEQVRARGERVRRCLSIIIYRCILASLVQHDAPLYIIYRWVCCQPTAPKI